MARTAKALSMLLATGLLGCGGGDDTDADAGLGDGGARTVVATGRVARGRAGARFADLLPFADAEVCLHPRDEATCVRTDADGAYRIEGLPFHGRAALGFRGTGHQGVLVSLVTDDRPPDIDVALTPEADVAARYAEAGVTADPSLGSLGALTLSESGPQSGVRVGVEPAAGEGPLYLDGTGRADATLEATSARGVAFFVDLPPGTHRVRFAHDARICDGAVLGWPGEEPGLVEVPVAPGLETALAVLCSIR